jgi:hypothetical protein
MEYSDHCIMTGWHGEQWDFQNNERTMEHSDHWIVTMVNSEILKTMKCQQNIQIMINGSQ